MFMTFWQKLQHFKYHKILLVFLFCILIFSLFQAPHGMGDPDGFYHARLSQMMTNNLTFQEFPWMQFSTLNENFTDHHFLYHLLLMPWTIVFDPLMGTKIFTVILSSLFITCFYWFLTRYNFQYKLPLLFLLFIFTSFFFRLSLIKATALSLIILLFIIYAIFEKKYSLILFLSFIYVWSYGGWLLGLVVGGIYIISETIYLLIKTKPSWKSLINKTFNFSNKKIIFNLVLGNLMGLIINPYFPQNIKFYWQQIWQIGIINYQKIVAVGNEWFSISLLDLGSHSIITTVIIILTFTWCIINYKKINRFTIFFALLTIFFLLLTLKSRRYLEYFIPFSTLFVGYSFTLNKLQLPTNRQSIIDFFKRPSHFIISIIIVMILCFQYGHSLYNVKKNLNRDKYLNYQGAAQYLQKHTPYHTTIFHPGWDDWPALFYYNPNNYYIGGLDPTFTYLYNSNLYQKWQQVVHQPANNDFYQIIKNDFHASYVFAPKQYKQFITNLNNNFYFKPIYSDDHVIIYQVL